MVAKKELVVIGAGLAGLSVGALLAKKGVEVLVIEEDLEVGGRARVIEKDGFILEYGPRSYDYGEKSSANQIMKELGLSPEWLTENEGNWLIKGKDLYQIPSLNQSLTQAELGYFTQEEISRLKQALEELSREKIEKYLRKSLADALGNLLKEEKLLLLSQLLGMELLEPEPKRLSAGELVLYLERKKSALANSCQLKGSSRVMIQAMVKTIERFAELKTRDRALTLEIEKNRVKSLNTTEGVIEPGAVVWTGSLAQFFQLAAAVSFPEKWLRKVKRMDRVSGLSLDFGLREKVSEVKGWLFEPASKILARFPSNLDPSLAPQGKQLSSWMILVSEQEVNDPEAVRSAIHQLRAQIKRVFPDFFALAEWERILHLPIIDSSTLTHKQSRIDRVEINAPGLENVFFAGDSIAAPGVRSEIALRSGIEASQRCLAYLGRGG